MPQNLPNLKYLHKVTARGHVYYYLRIKHKLVAKLPDIEDPTFLETYVETLNAYKQNKTVKVIPKFASGTLGWVIDTYKNSPEFENLSEKTKDSYVRELRRLDPIRPVPIADIKRPHIRAIRDDLADKPRTQYYFGQVCSRLFNFAITELDIEMVNPAQGLKRTSTGESYKRWSEEQMAKFEASNPPPELLTAYYIARYVGPRRGDLANLKRTDWDGKSLTITASKTKTKVKVPAHPRLAKYLNNLTLGLNIISDSMGRPVQAVRLTRLLKRHLKGIGLEGLHLHGLRHTAGNELAEAGCTTKEVQSVLGHLSTQMAERYTSQVEQNRMAVSAIKKLQKKN